MVVSDQVKGIVHFNTKKEELTICSVGTGVPGLPEYKHHTYMQSTLTDLRAVSAYFVNC